MARRGTFNAEAFFSALDACRQSRRLTWKQAAAQSGVSASTLTRMAQGKRPDVDSFAALASWAGLNTDDFVKREHIDEQSEPLAMICTYLRSDPHLTTESATALEELVKSVYERLRKDKGDDSP